MTGADDACVHFAGCVLGGAAVLAKGREADRGMVSRSEGGPGDGGGGGGGGDGGGGGRKAGPVRGLSAPVLGPVLGVSLIGQAECTLTECSIMYADGAGEQWAKSHALRSGAVAGARSLSLSVYIYIYIYTRCAF